MLDLHNDPGEKGSDVDERHRIHNFKTSETTVSSRGNQMNRTNEAMEQITCEACCYLKQSYIDEMRFRAEWNAEKEHASYRICRCATP